MSEEFTLNAVHTLILIIFAIIAYSIIEYVISRYVAKYKFNRIKIGDKFSATYCIYGEGPFEDTCYTTIVEVIDKKDGWLKIKFDDGGVSSKDFYEFFYIDHFKKVENV